MIDVMIDVTDLASINAEIAKLGRGESMHLRYVPSHIYHSSNGYGSTMVKAAIDSYATLKARMDGLVKVEGDHLDLGQAVHCRVLESHLFDELFVCQSSDVKTRRGKVWDAFRDANPGKTILRPGDWKKCFPMSENVLEQYAKYFTGGESEVSYWKRDEETGLIIKARLDYDLDNFGIDLKTTKNANPNDFTRNAIKLGYHVQGEMYKDVAEKTAFAFILVENEQPFLTAGPYLFEEEAKRLGYLEYRKALKGIAHCLETDVWPGYGNQPVMMGLKPWELDRLEQLEGEI